METLERLERVQERMESILVDLRNSETVTITPVTAAIMQTEACIEEAKTYNARAIERIKRGAK